MTDGLNKRIIRSRRRTLALEVTADAALIVRAPNRVSLEAIDTVVREKLPWILEKQRLARQRYQPPVKKEFVNGEEFLYLGEPYKLVVVNDALPPLVLNGKELLFSDQYRSRARDEFLAWYKEQALQVIGQRVKLYADPAGLKYRRISITRARTCWGSCGVKGTLNFTWRLIMAPLNVVDYVVAHELAHLEERNHSSRFWQKVGVIFPDYPPARKWLRVNHRRLEL